MNVIRTIFRGAVLAAAGLAMMQAGAQVTTRDMGGSYGTHNNRVPVPVPVPVPDTFNRNAQPSEPITTSGNSCTCQVVDNGGGACMIFLRTNSADWIVKNAPQTALRSSAGGRYYDAPFPLAASACAGRKVAPAGVKVHWLDRKNAILEWK
ncbi:hypothetical protein HNO84_17750 [Herbaspirillum robiniae]|uniref:Uncharacterized protein n=2 Tax=Herbaspirillum robiniae TaxID=2014887 RepID=A0A2D0B6L3_9BURK|nr:hypothetical protein [Herbaspirillum robiniae]NUU03457.1 hypothetical protein [Herbaspirillum robiniae]OWY30028.1 hypothetical protein CEJ42_09320 [Herbaspirillum robiniae]